MICAARLVYIIANFEPLLKVTHVDNNGYTALSHAVLGAHIEVIKYLANCAWPAADMAKCDAIQTAFVLGASKGHVEVTEFLLEKLQESVKCHIDSADHMTGDTGELHKFQCVFINAMT